jgi:predicted AlkP superfamily pyrophosphatase or phosphodiesterase
MAFIAGLVVALTVMVGRDLPHEVRAAAPARPMVAARLAPVALEPPPPAPPPQVHHVLIISEDGMRPDALTEERAPNHHRLMREGSTARTCDTIDQSDTLPSHASMLSGVPVQVHGVRWGSLQPSKGFIKVPTIFSIAKQHGLKTAIFAGKTKLRHLARPGTVDVFERPTFLCSGVVKRATEYMLAEKPEVMFVHFSDPDEYGHSDGWMSPAYLQGVTQSDRCLGKMMDALVAAGIADTTLVIVTADHGGHNRTHSGAKHIEVDRHIPWIARGPGVPAGAWIEETVDTVDTAATGLAALKLEAPEGMTGVSRFVFPE